MEHPGDFDHTHHGAAGKTQKLTEMNPFTTLMGVVGSYCGGATFVENTRAVLHGPMGQFVDTSRAVASVKKSQSESNVPMEHSVIFDVTHQDASASTQKLTEMYPFTVQMGVVDSHCGGATMVGNTQALLEEKLTVSHGPKAQLDDIVDIRFEDAFATKIRTETNVLTEHLGVTGATHHGGATFLENTQTVSHGISAQLGNFGDTVRDDALVKKS